MRRLLVAVVVVAIVSLAAAGVAGGDRSLGRVRIPGGLSVRVPLGWHVLRGWLSDVTDPSPRLAVGSFPAKLSRSTCACGFPNVVSFPRDGAFVFVWEYLRPSRRGLARAPSRPAGFHLGGGHAVHLTCDGSSDTYGFKDAGRLFQVEVYLGPQVGRALRRRTEMMLTSLRVAPAALATGIRPPELARAGGRRSARRR